MTVTAEVVSSDSHCHHYSGSRYNGTAILTTEVVTAGSVQKSDCYSGSRYNGRVAAIITTKEWLFAAEVRYNGLVTRRSSAGADWFALRQVAHILVLFDLAVGLVGLAVDLAFVWVGAGSTSSAWVGVLTAQRLQKMSPQILHSQ
jgi:hypothetical protein